MHRTLPRRLIDRAADCAPALGAYDAATGLILLVSPAIRVSSPAFDTAKAFAPMTAWGAALLILGVGLLITAHRGHHPGVTLAVAGSWHGFFAAALTCSAISDPHVALTGILTYTVIMTVHLLAALRRVC